MPAWTWHSPSQRRSLRPVTFSSQRPRIHVREEQDLLVLGDRLDDGLRVSGRAAVVALRLHLGRRVHVRDDDGTGILGLPLAQLVCSDRGGQGAPRVEVRDEDGLLRREDRCRLGHEVNAAEDDRLGFGARRLAGEPERVADVVRDVLNLGYLVVVGEDHRIALGRERTDLLLHGRDHAHGALLPHERGGVWGTGTFPTISGRRGQARFSRDQSSLARTLVAEKRRETWFPSPTRAEGECSVVVIATPARRRAKGRNA